MSPLQELRQARRIIQVIIEVIFPNGIPIITHKIQLGIFIDAINLLASFALDEFPAETTSGPESEDTLIRAALSQIVALTAAGLVASPYYCGHQATLSHVWVQTTCKLQASPSRFIFGNGMRLISLGEDYPPHSCSHEYRGRTCNKPTHSVYIHEEDFTEDFGVVPYDSGPALINFALCSGKGRAFCDRHSPRPTRA